MDISRRTVFKGLAAASALPLFNIGCANFGMSRARQIGGVFPLLCTPYSEDGSLDCETLSREVAFRGFKGPGFRGRARTARNASSLWR